MNDCISIYIYIYAYTGISICVICMYRLEYMHQCIRINPTVKYHVYPFVLATACAVYASKVLPYAAHTLAIC